MTPTDRWAHRRAEPRQFVVFWTLFLFLASILALGGTGFIGLVQPDLYRPAARILLAVAGTGIALLWPMVRLSQVAPDRPRASFALDAAVVVAPAVGVAMAQCLPWMAGWPLSAGMVISTVFAAWGVLIGGALAWYFTHLEHAVPRWAWMALLSLAAAIGPAFALTWPDVSPENPRESRVNIALMASPITAVFEACADRSWSGTPAMVGPEHWGAALGLWPPALTVWFLSRRRRRPLAFSNS